MKRHEIKKFSIKFSGLLPVFVLAHFGHHLLTALPTPLLPLIRDEFKLDYTQSAVVVSSFSIVYGISQLPAGWLADRIGARMLITVGICGVAVAGLLIGLSQTYILLLVFMALMGLFGGGYHPSAAPLVASVVEPQNRGRALGLHLIGGSASFFLTPLIAAAMAAVWGWRGAFIGLAIPAMALGLGFYLLLGRRGVTPEVRTVVASPEQARAVPPGYLRQLVAFLILTTIAGVASSSIMPFIPLFMVDHFGVTRTAAAALLSITYSAGLWASPLGGYLSDRVGRMPVIVASSLASGVMIYLFTRAPWGFGIIASLLLIGMAMYVRGPASEAFVVIETPPRYRSLVLGIYYSAGMEAGAIFTPVMGSLIDHHGFTFSFAAVSIGLVAITLLCAPFLLRKGREKVN